MMRSPLALSFATHENREMRLGLDWNYHDLRNSGSLMARRVNIRYSAVQCRAGHPSVLYLYMKYELSQAPRLSLEGFDDWVGSRLEGGKGCAKGGMGWDGGILVRNEGFKGRSGNVCLV